MASTTLSPTGSRSHSSDPYADDLFQNSQMTFGEHLEELRVALFRALLAITVGFCIGLLFGKQVVQYIQAPLTEALQGYYAEQAEAQLLKQIEDRRAAGEAIPELTPEMLKVMTGQGLIPEELLVDGAQLLESLRNIHPEQFVTPPPSDPPAEQNPAREKVEQAATDKQDASVADATASAPQLIPIITWKPLAYDSRTKVKSLSVTEGFMIYIKASLVSGIIMASPVVFWALWTFVAAGLYPHERNYVYYFMPISIGLFLAGVLLVYFVVFRIVLGFLLGFNAGLGIDPDPRISEWMSFVLMLPIGFGLSFQLPLIMLFMERIGVMSVELYLSKWRIAVLVIAILSMVLTPTPDPATMMLMCLPLIALYFGGIALCKYLPRRKSPLEAAI